MSTTDLIEALHLHATAATVSALPQAERRQLQQACDRLQRSLESPLDTTARLVFSAHQAMAIRLGVDLKLFDAIAARAGPVESSASSFKVHELTEELRADPLLVRRIVRFLAAMDVVSEVERDAFVQTPLAAAFVSSSPLSAAVIHSTHFTTVLSRLPEYFHANGWTCPNDGFDGPFQFAMGTDVHYFDFLSSHEYYGQAFNTVMSSSFRRRGRDWFEFFPVAKRLQGVKDTDALIVDIGGGQGEDLKNFRTQFPSLPGTLILQDLQAVVEGAHALPGIEAQGYNFFEPQPVRGARVYFMRTVLHDWPDRQAAQILGRVRDAMSDESILLISETLLPESGVLLSSVISDMQMMGSFASLERTEEQWRTLLEDCGFELVSVWLPQECDHSAKSLSEQPALLEARLMRHAVDTSS
ncbi:hypothetical protein N7532_010659 [Penicillium argentinense]|uniref:O-methyltransferase domain-containing protein n=1 Tax=Penicillium argentinense TaxID=1131581 RepID=A0A9W9JY51_9EURO|nr:uncharacterized protein N7532_010659 [Penicillium argentinense]KAJ5085888.1 hypothetical protein N7532_010659 [Penicillium argentinense]